MPQNDELTTEQQSEIAKRHQQANWVLGGIIIVGCFCIGNAISMATTQRFYILVSLVVGIGIAWAINKFAK